MCGNAGFRSDADVGSNTQSCTKCGDGKFSTQGSLACGFCFAGKYSLAPPLPVGNFECQLCPRGQYITDTGQSNCIPCDPGYVNVREGARFCDACQSCSFVNTSGATACDECDVDTFCSDSGCVKCTPCGQDMTTETRGSLSCYRFGTCPLEKYTYVPPEDTSAPAPPTGPIDSSCADGNNIRGDGCSRETQLSVGGFVSMTCRAYWGVLTSTPRPLLMHVYSIQHHTTSQCRKDVMARFREV